MSSALTHEEPFSLGARMGAELAALRAERTGVPLANGRQGMDWGGRQPHASCNSPRQSLAGGKPNP